MTDDEYAIGKQIKDRLVEYLPQSFALKMGKRLSQISFPETDLEGFITQEGQNYAIMKVELRSLYYYNENSEKVYPHFAKQAKDAGYSYAVIYRAYGDKEEFLIRDLRKGLSSSAFVPVSSFDELLYILFNEPSNTPSQLDWKMGVQRVMNAPEQNRWDFRNALLPLQKAHVTFDAATKQCFVNPEAERDFFKELLRPYDNEYICRYTTYGTLERILRDRKQSVCSVVCMNDETECYYADEYLEKQGGKKVAEVLDANYEELNKCQISSCTDIKSADRLSLWRMYGDDGKGVCLKFKIVKAKLAEKDFFLYSMNYPFMLNGEHYELDLISDLRKMLIKGFSFEFKLWHIWKHFFKPVHYYDEHEVRLLYFKKDTDEFKWIKTGDSQILAPVIEFSIKKNENEFPLVLSEIILGPKFPEAATNAAQIRYFKELQKIEEDGDCPVTPSKIKGYR